MVELSPGQLLKQIARQHQFVAGQAVFEVGHEARAVYRVVSGEVQLYRYDIAGHRVLLHRAFGGDFFAEASLDATHYHCTALCARDSDIEIFNARSIKRLLAENRVFQQFWMAHLALELRRQRANVERLSLKSAADRVAHYLMTEGNPAGELTLQGTVSEWADMLGLSREALYRTLSKMKKNGTLQQQGAKYRLLFSDV